MRKPSVRHQNGYLMQALRTERPKVPHGCGAAQVRLGMALLSVNKIPKLQRIADQEYWCIVADQIPVAFFRVELNREGPNVTLSVGGAISPATVENRKMRSVFLPTGLRLSPACVGKGRS